MFCNRRLWILFFVLEFSRTVFSQTNLNFGPEAESQTFPVNAPVSWNVTDNRTWITISPTSGTGNTMVTVSVTANTSTSARTGTISVYVSGILTATVTVVQAGVVLTAAPSTLAFSEVAGSKTIAITANVSWNVTDDASWMTVSPTSGTNDAAITVTVSANSSANLRSGAVTVAGGGLTTVITVQQGGVTLAVSPTSLTFPPVSGSSTFMINTSYPWNVSDDAAWITVSPASGAGDATATVTVSVNSSTSSRSGTVTISGGGANRSITITQGGVVLEVSPMSKFYGAGSESASFSINSNAEWIVTSFAPWISVSPTSGSGNGVVTATVSANASERSRTGEFAVSAWSIIKTITVDQDGVLLTATPLELFFTSGVGSKKIAISTNVAWSVFAADSWITVSPSSGASQDTVAVTVSANPSGSRRTGTVTLSGGGVIRTISVTQERSLFFSLSPDILNFEAGAGSRTIIISANVNWSVSGQPEWVAISPLAGYGDATLTVSVPANTSTNSRTGIFNVNGMMGSGVSTKKVTIRQDGVSSILTASKTGLVIGSPVGSSRTFGIASNIGWSILCDASWLNISPIHGFKNGTVTVAANEANILPGSRNAVVTVSGDNISRRVSVTQIGRGIGDECTPYALHFDGKGNYVDCGNDSSLMLEKEFTLCAWIYRASASGDWERILAKSDDKEYDYWLQLKPFEYSVSGGFIIKEGFYAKHLDSTPGTPIPLKEWTHLAVTYDGTRLAGYRNGVLDKSREFSHLLQKSDKHLLIGRLQNSYHFNGMIDEVTIWNRALSPQQIRENMHCKHPADASGLKAHWHFDEGVDSLTQDFSGYQNHGAIHGAAWNSSTVPVAAGKSQSQIIGSTGRVEFPETHLTMTITEKKSIDTLVVTELSCEPAGGVPSELAYYDSTRYWIIEQYGSGTLKADITFYLDRKSPTLPDHARGETLVLLTRSPNSDGEWRLIAQAASAAEDSITFKDLSALGQFMIGAGPATCAEKGPSRVGYDQSFYLSHNYPNPFNPCTTIEMTVPRSAYVTLAVYNLKGERIATLVSGEQEPGIHRIVWNAGGFASGVYLYRLEAEGYVQSKKLILMR
ncbi:MAG TPA: BACON domain-containing carbohydrate-binding protein [bacterium]|nr:BACON domain-containing carbohydrate-binding protein [bacterium]